jgi:creatinine amidohydrolase
MTEPCLIEELTWPQLAELVGRGQTLCVLPVGATEQHGRHLPAGTDSLIVEAICRTASGLTGVPVLPTLRISSSHAHRAAWPGTFSLPPRLVIEVVAELGSWVRASGFDRLLIVNGHAGNRATLKVAVEELRSRGGLRAGVVHWFDLTPEIESWVNRDAEDWHANAAETSLMLHLRPDLVSTDAIQDDPDRTTGLLFSYTVAETSVDGLTGRPSDGTASDGKQLFALAVDALANLIDRARREAPPRLDEKGPDPAGAAPVAVPYLGGRE